VLPYAPIARLRGLRSREGRNGKGGGLERKGRLGKERKWE